MNSPGFPGVQTGRDYVRSCPERELTCGKKISAKRKRFTSPVPSYALFAF